MTNPFPGVRWTARRKAAIVQAVQLGQLTREDLARAGITADEFDHWHYLRSRWGRAALRSTHLTRLRRRDREAAAQKGSAALASLIARREEGTP
jgi:hypothetical protein